MAGRNEDGERLISCIRTCYKSTVVPTIIQEHRDTNRNVARYRQKQRYRERHKKIYRKRDSQTDTRPEEHSFIALSPKQAFKVVELIPKSLPSALFDALSEVLSEDWWGMKCVKSASKTSLLLPSEMVDIIYIYIINAKDEFWSYGKCRGSHN